MIDALISGRLRGGVTVRTAANGKPFATWTLAAFGKAGESLLCSCIAFSTTAIDAAQRMGDGDSMAVSGEIAVKLWQGKDGTQRHGLNVTVYGVMTAYHLGRKRKATEPTDNDNERGPL
jgi:single-stranded DNA-binding protein